jgi:acyl-CoA synthetase (AMP-forming)/AMP-acid ligase II
VSDSANIARHLPLMAARQPDHPAVKVPRSRTGDGRIDYLTLTFRELDAEVNAWVARLKGRGVRQGDRVLVMVRQGLPLIAAAFALFKLGAVPVIIDPGMGRKSFLACVARSKPPVLLGIPLAQVLSHVFRAAFASVEIRIWVRGSATAQLAKKGRTGSRPSAADREVGPPGVADTRSDDLAAILFTSGSTGAPKGVCYEHGMFEAQVRLVRDAYDIQPGEVDLPMLPIFALFNPALGMTTVVPELDPSRPANVDPAKIVRAIQQEGVTNSFGSPTLWRKIFDHCLTHQITLPSLKRVLCAGAAVPASLWADAKHVIPNGELHSPYGATEVLPVATTSETEVEKSQIPEAKSQTGGPDAGPGSSLGAWNLGFGLSGSLVGRPLPKNRVKIIALHDGPIATLAETRELNRGEVGEIIVTGPTVTKAYDALPEATALAKIAGAQPDGSPTTWHRMGDAGYLDASGTLWFCGRIAERVVTAAGDLHTEPCEQVFRRHPAVTRCALIGLGERGRQEPAIVIQLKPGVTESPAQLAGDFRSLARQHPHTAAIRRFFFHPALPVDVRHNAKIHRLTLARWAATEASHEIP